MKYAIIAAVCIVALLLCSCRAKEQSKPEPPVTQTVTFRNGVKDADVWILPDTEANRKTTVWGTATAAKVKTGEDREAPLCDPGDNGLYLFRMIDTDSFYYSASGIELKAGWTMRLTGEDLHSITLAVTDENGALQRSYEVFAARL